MELFLNELSLHGQFADPGEVLAALARVMRMREVARGHGRSIRVATVLRERPATGGSSFEEIVRRADVNTKRAVLAWVDKDGPFLEEEQLSSPADEVTCAGKSVSGSSLAEAACRKLIGEAAALAGFTPSTFDLHPLTLETPTLTHSASIEVENYWSAESLRVRLGQLSPPPRSWTDFDAAVRRDQPDLFFAPDCMRLEGHPFHLGVSVQIAKLLGMLAELKRAILPNGTYGDGYNDLWRRYTSGGELFSDSSDSDKRDHEAKLTFNHPEIPGAKLWCPWHAKVNSPKIRIHFSFPIQRSQPLYVVYIGLKLTRH